MMGWYGGFGGWGWIGMAMMLTFWVAVVLLAVWGGRALFPGARASGDDAAAILKRRFAAGELSAAEYEQARRTLE